MHPSRYRINTGTVPIPNFSDNYLGDNYLNCIYNYRYRFLSKLLFLHPFMQWFSPFCHFVYCLLPTCNVQYCLTLLQFPRGESPAPRTIQRPANHNKAILNFSFRSLISPPITLRFSQLICKSSIKNCTMICLPSTLFHIHAL